MSATAAVRSTARSAAKGAAQLATAGQKSQKPAKLKLLPTKSIPVVNKLPQRLLNFFARYPPEHYSGAAQQSLKNLRPALVSLQAEPAAAAGEAKTEETKTDATGTQPAEAVAAAEGTTENIASATASANAEKIAEAGSQAAETQSTETTTEATKTTITAELGKLPSPYTPNRDAKGTKKPDPTVWSPSRVLLQSSKEYPNPFLPRKNTRTGKWWSPKYSLRVQADLVKLAKKHGVEELLPIGPKSTIYKETRRMERGLAVKGTGIGQKVKGHKWERLLETKLEDRRKAMMEMPELIRLWKQRGHGRGWKKWPKR